ncbi:glycosyltransferase family 32 protein [Limosilactobacillus reuteri]|uniref:glycosyltransferase family 32 protein n=1 Tax=Limosilactobacillus reuteri TaxID=1598 RepID=UPI001E52877D|nr:glycosyltransferase [Limosilactobacillus reuteri]MCC4481315.1 hypothetical protein [Limosilactobacillus reuteri]
MIPKTINYIWLGKKKKPKLVKDAIKSWRKKAPEYKIVEWNEEKIDSIMDGNSFYYNALNNKNFSFASDYARLAILYNYGGIYLDTDIILTKNPSKYLKDRELVLGIENPKRGYILTAFIASIPHQNFIGLLLNSYENKIYDKSKLVPNSQEIGAIAFKKFNLEYKGITQFRNESKIVIYSPNILYQPSFQSVAIHIGMASWEENLRLHDRLRVKTRRHIHNRFEAGIFRFVNDIFRRIIPNI